MKLDWMKEVDWQEGLTEDLRMVLDVIGEDAVLALLDRLPSQRVAISTAVIRTAQREYIAKYATSKSARKIAYEIGSSERFVQRVIQEED